MESPFQFGKIVSGSSFTDRTEHLRKLKNNLAGGISTILISPRRWGKSSLVNRCVEEYFDGNYQYKIVMLDMFKIRTEEEFFEIYAREAIKALSGKLEEILDSSRSFFKALVPKISISPDSISEFSLSFDPKELKRNRSEILELPEKIAEKKGCKVIFCIDEFQNIELYDNTRMIQRELRSSWQGHKNVTYCVYGSKRHMMSGIFNESGSPFYRFGDVIFLDKISKSDWVDFIVASFRGTGKEISDIHAGRIAETMRNHPFYVQQLSHIVWNLTDETVSRDILEKAQVDIIDNNLPFLMNEYEKLSSSQINLLKAVCNGENRLNSAEVLHEYKLGTSGNVSKNKTLLTARDVIDIQDNGIEFIDPVFEAWFRGK